MSKNRKQQADPTVTFWGAARSVTGSMHRLDAVGRSLLLDCGLFQGPRAESRHRNRDFPFPPKQIDAVLLSHAHIDHCGNLPNLVRQGFKGPIYCTPATRDLAVQRLNLRLISRMLPVERLRESASSCWTWVKSPSMIPTSLHNAVVVAELKPAPAD